MAGVEFIKLGIEEASMAMMMNMNVFQSTWAFKLKHFSDRLSQSSKLGFVLQEIRRLKGLISLKLILLLFNGQ